MSLIFLVMGRDLALPSPRDVLADVENRHLHTAGGLEMSTAHGAMQDRYDDRRILVQ